MHMRMRSLADGRRQLQRYGRPSNTHIPAWLDMRWPNQALGAYLGVTRQERLFGQVCQTAFRHCTSRFLRSNL